MPESVGAWKRIVHGFLCETTFKRLKEILKRLPLLVYWCFSFITGRWPTNTPLRWDIVNRFVNKLTKVNIYIRPAPKIDFVNPRVWSIIRTKLGGDLHAVFFLFETAQFTNARKRGSLEANRAWLLAWNNFKHLKEILKLLKLKYQETRHRVLYCYPRRVGFDNNTLNNQLQT